MRQGVNPEQAFRTSNKLLAKTNYTTKIQDHTKKEASVRAYSALVRKSALEVESRVISTSSTVY